MIHYILDVNESYSTSASYNRVRLFVDGLHKLSIRSKINLLVFQSRLHKRYISYVKNLLKMLILLLKVSKKDVVIIYDITHYYYLYKWYAKKTNLVIEMTEYPHHIIVQNIGDNYKKTSQRNCEAFKYASSFITCSSYLQNYYRRIVSDVFISPLIVNVEEIDKIEVSSNEYEYIAYCGSFINNKDGIPNLLNSYALFHNIYPKVQLVLIGSGDTRSLNQINTIINDLGIKNSVVLTGALKHDEVLKWLKNSCMLVLARPNNKQAEGGIPSKVAEYLASGVPCVITKTGDLPKYLHDGVDCFLCDPDDENIFFQKMVECYNSDRTQIGCNAKRIVRQFNYIEQSSLLVDYLENKFTVKLRS